MIDHLINDMINKNYSVFDMASSEISKKWIEAGYELFAVTGPKDFKVEKLANQLGLNKSGFYHYFVDREMFFEELMKFHKEKGASFAQELSKLNDFMPGYPLTLISYHTALQVQMHLRLNLNHPVFKDAYFMVKKGNYKYQIPLWAKYLHLTDMQLAIELFEIAVDLMLIRLDGKMITFDYLEGIFGGIKLTAEKLRLQK